MNPEHWQQVKELLQAALELGPGERAPFLDKACVGDPALRAEIELLIELDEQVDDFLDAPLSNVAARLLISDQIVRTEERITLPYGDVAYPESDQLIGRTLGEFTIREKLGEGGFGVVYRAEQLALAREAVVKVMHARHRGTRQVIERFVREARLASHLEHPYTAHVYAFGAEPDNCEERHTSLWGAWAERSRNTQRR